MSADHDLFPNIETELVGETVVPWRPGYGLLDRWNSNIDSDDFPYVVEMEFVADKDGPRCESVRFVRREGGPEINARDIRKVPIARCFQAAIGAAALHEARTPAGINYTFPGAWQGQGTAVLGSISEAYKLARPTDVRTKDARLREVATVYASAQETGKPTQAVRDALHMSYSTAARLVGEARRRGFLPPARQRDQRKDER